MPTQSFLKKLSHPLLLGSLALFFMGSANANPYDNTTLVENQDIAKAQAIGIITSFMSDGAQSCDANGQNCRSVFGSDDTPDYASLSQMSKGAVGAETFSFRGSDGNASSISTQTGSKALACGDDRVHLIAGVAFKTLDCNVKENGDAQVTFQTCTAPMRGNPVTQPEDAVMCSTNPSDPDFRPPYGKVCMRAACDTEPLDSLNGWSTPKTVTWDANLPANASEEEKTNNGLAMIFYPSLEGGVTPSFKADSDNLTVVKVVQTARNNETGATAIGLKLAYRHKAVVTKEMMETGAASVPDPGAHTAQWDTVVKLSNNAMIPQYQEKYAKYGTEHLQAINQALATDGEVEVYDKNYTNESGVKPIALTAKIAAEGQDCGTTTQCLEQVTNTNTWTQTCQSDIPLSMRNCTTTTDFTRETITSHRSRSKDRCVETRFNARYSCLTTAIPSCTSSYSVGSGGMDLSTYQSDIEIKEIGYVDPITRKYRFGSVGNNNYWTGDGYMKREFAIDIQDVNNVNTFRLYHVYWDDSIAISINGHWVWVNWYRRGSEVFQSDRWGAYIEKETCRLVGSYDDGNYECTKYNQFQSLFERNNSFNSPVNVDFKPYLREGRNIIRMDVGVVDGGEGWMHFEISAYHPQCDNIIENECQQYEQSQ